MDDEFESMDLDIEPECPDLDIELEPLNLDVEPEMEPETDEGPSALDQMSEYMSGHNYGA